MGRGAATVLYHDWGGVTGVYTSDGLHGATHTHTPSAAYQLLLHYFLGFAQTHVY